jgi:hypothetical protein
MTTREKATAFDEWAASNSSRKRCGICTGFSEGSLDMIRDFLRLKAEGRCKRSYAELADKIREEFGDDANHHGIGRHIRDCETDLHRESLRGR